jgi:hypothetical protein
MKMTSLASGASALMITTVLAASAGLASPGTEGGSIAAASPPAWYTADDSYGSQGFHHGLPDTMATSSTEPVAGDADAMIDAAILPRPVEAD